MKRRTVLGLGAASLFVGALPLRAATPGVSATEIKIGQTAAYSGPASISSPVAKTQLAYFDMINAKGGINGRKVNLISLDDGYSPPKTVEQVRRLVEQDEVLLIFGQIGTAPGLASRAYLNAGEVPQLFTSGGAAAFNNPKEFPWTVGTSITYRGEAIQFGKYIAKHLPDAKVGIIFQNDDFGRDYQRGVRQGLGDKADEAIIAEQGFETTEPTIESQLLSLRAAGVDVLVIGCITKYAIMALSFLGKQNWRPQVMLTNGSISVSQVLEPAGKENALNALTATPYKDASDPRWKDDPEYKNYTAFMAQYAKDLNPNDQYALSGYITVQLMAEVLRRAGDDLSRENILKVVTNLEGYRPGMVGADVSIRITPDNYDMFQSLQFMKFNGTNWEPVDAGLTGG
ncbi:ABC transporter substrate-binding protein [Gemmobacter sp.]|uniref:ABC transporter substrate-binding protein n=1 Tax=Gemmobacter sp. TaxID=1898957 RepID=UPI002AFDE995|nr:ABC transporter substrate-binding protein [Gemmobacter sp.]